MKLRLAKLPGRLENQPQSEQLQIIRKLLRAALSKAGVECSVTNNPQNNILIVTLRNEGLVQADLPLSEVWAVFTDRVKSHFREIPMYGGVDFAQLGALHTGIRYETKISDHNTIVFTTHWSHGKGVEFTITILATGEEAKAYCKVEPDPRGVN